MLYNSLRANSSDKSIDGQHNIGEKWLRKFGLEDDTLGSILLDYCGFRNNKVPVSIKKGDLSHGKIAISITFPGTEVTKIIMVDIEKVDFIIGESIQAGAVLAKIFLNDYQDDSVWVSTEDCPDYDPDTETALDGVDWDDAVKLLAFELHLSRNTYENKFPDA